MTTDRRLNKNQLVFFEEAVPYFGVMAKSVKLADLKKFADTHGLIVPVSFLNNFCKTDARGHYDITKSGVETEKETGLFALGDDFDVDDDDVIAVDTKDRIDEEHDTDTADEHQSDAEPEPVPTPESTIITSQSVYAEPERQLSSFHIPGTKRTTFINPVYAIQDSDGNLRGICDTPHMAYKNANFVLRGTYSITESQAINALDTHGVVVIRCVSATSLKAIITKMEMNDPQ